VSARLSDEVTVARVRAAGARELAAMEALLASSSLPTEGVAERLGDFLVAEAAGEVVGLAGLERHGPDGLLRSVAVSPSWRGRGLGVALTEGVLEHARTLGLRAVYLLTTTAEDYFPRHGFRRIERDAVPEGVASSAEFRELCPASAVVMTLELSPPQSPGSPPGGYRSGRSAIPGG
jgi:N-acetylglutamate synthase-like GNAT family acetyltransferase